VSHFLRNDQFRSRLFGLNRRGGLRRDVCYGTRERPSPLRILTIPQCSWSPPVQSMPPPYQGTGVSEPFCEGWLWRGSVGQLCGVLHVCTASPYRPVSNLLRAACASRRESSPKPQVPHLCNGSPRRSGWLRGTVNLVSRVKLWRPIASAVAITFQCDTDHVSCLSVSAGTCKGQFCCQKFEVYFDGPNFTQVP